MSLGETYVRCSVGLEVGQSYALHREVFLDEDKRPFVILHCHFNAHFKKAIPWVVELKNEPGEDDGPWSMHYLEDDQIEVDSISGVMSHFQQPLAHFAKDDGGDVVKPLFLMNEYDLGPTWTDFYKGDRKVARVYTHYYSRGKDLNENPLPDLLWVHPEPDSDTESEEYDGV